MRYLTTSLLILTAAPALAQTNDRTTPGMPNRPVPSGQTDRFSNEFNPAIGGVFDIVADHVDHDSGEETDGLDLRLRAFEVLTNAWIDPNAWAYAVIRGADEGIEVEEAAVHYVGFEGNTTLRAGRFFVDFGKQMQAHLDELNYPNRPAVLREYLGEELAGNGLQLDHWWATGDKSAVRASFGVFDSLLGGHDHGHGEEHGGEDEDHHEAEIHMPGRSDFGDLNLTLRLTGFHDVGESGVFQWGLSAREVPEFAFEYEDEDSGDEFEAEGMANSVLGADLTYGVTDETGVAKWTFGAEALMFTGDIGAEFHEDDGELEVIDDDVSGYYAWAEHGLDKSNAFGVLLSTFEHPEEDAPEDTELPIVHCARDGEHWRLQSGDVTVRVGAGPDGLVPVAAA